MTVSWTALAGRVVRRDAGGPFFLDREGVPHGEGNRFCTSGRMRNLAAGVSEGPVCLRR
jgi:hypothetical protein